MIDALTTKSYAPKTLRQIAAAVPNIVYSALQHAIAILVGMGTVTPCQSEAAERQVQARYAVLNLHLRQQSQYGNRIQKLANLVTGGGVPVGRFHQLFLLAIKQGKKQPAEWAQCTWQILAEQGQYIIKDGKALTTAKENLAELTLQANEFAEKALVVLKPLRIA